MDFRGQIYFIHLTVIFLAKVIIGQDVTVGTADFQEGKRAQINCAFNDGVVSALFWRYSQTDVKEVPTGNVIIQYSKANNISIPPGSVYQGRVQLTEDYGLVIKEVENTDMSLQYWCHVNIGVIGSDSTNVTRIDPVTPGEITDNCVPTSKCKTGNSIYCTVSCFNPSDDFNLKWTVDGEVRSDTTTEVTPSDSGNCFDGKSTYTIGENDAIGSRTFGCEPKGRAYQYATPEDDYSLSKDIEIVKVTTPTKNVGAIVGGVFGGIVVIGGVVGGVVYVCVYKEKN